jgi:glycosyltransferase involved in cell wall biosynthesis
MVSKLTPDLLIITPARNEAKNLNNLANSLARQSLNPILAWVIVDDGSTDETSQTIEAFKIPFRVELKKRHKSGNLITGAAFAAWWEGVNFGIELYPHAKFVMKLDADVILDNHYFANIYNETNDTDSGVIGGVISDFHREQKSYVPGPVKMYSRLALEVIRELPIATGFDVMDEILCKEKGLNTQIIPAAKFTMSRQIGHSQGLLHGRFRNGLVCKWVGYAPEYFVRHAIRYLFRAPYLFGSIWMVYGYFTSGKGPYPQRLRSAHKVMQRRRLIQIIKHPVKTLRNLYV